jgi:flagellar assembly factor FliW
MNTDAIVEPSAPVVSAPIAVQLPYGLLGFEKNKKFLLVAKPDEDPFMWLQMTEGDKKAFLIVSPFLVMPEYQPDIAQPDVDFLGLTDPSDALVFNICTLRGKNGPTINLKGPIVINRHTLLGKQIIPQNAEQYSLTHPLPVA